MPQMRTVAHRANGNNLISIFQQISTGNGVTGIAEITPQGDTLWFRQFNRSGTSNGSCFVNFMKELPNHTIFMAGGTHFSSGFYHSAFWLADSLGHVTAYQQMLFPNNLNITLNDVDVATDGSFYFAGSHYDVYSGGVTFYSWTEPAYGKLNANLTLAWGKTWGTGNHTNSNHNSGAAYGIKVCPDNNIVVMGTDAQYNNGSGFYEIAKVTPGGTQIWKYERAMAANNFPVGIDVSNHGDIYWTAALSNASTVYGNADVVVQKLNSNGSLAWSKSFGTAQNESVTKIRFDESANAVLLAGQHYYNGTEYSAWFSKIDTAGALVFNKLFGLPATYDVFNDVIPSGSNYLLAGNAGNSGAYLVQTDNAGTTSCTVVDLTVQSGNYAAAFSPGVTHSGRTFTFTGYTLAYYGYVLTPSTNCYACSNVVQNSIVTACQSYFAGGGVQTTSGVYSDTYPAFGGCDSVVTTNLTIQQPPTASFAGANQNVCTNSASLTGNSPTVGTGHWTLVSGTGTIVNANSANTGVNGLAVGSNVFQWTISNGVCTPSSSTVTITVGSTTAGNITASACINYTLNAQTYTSSGIYTQTLTNSVGCDSLLSINLTIYAATGNSLGPVACDSYTLNSQTYTSSGLYTQVLTNANGCDSTLLINLVIHTSPTVTYSQNPSLVCENWAPFALSAGSPAGGTYVGTAITTNVFDPTQAGVGTFGIQYTYTDVNGCSGTDGSAITVDACTGVNEFGMEELAIYPNPSNGEFQISNLKFQIESIEITNLLGQTVYESEICNLKSEISVDISKEPKGIYFINIQTTDSKYVNRKMLIE